MFRNENHTLQGQEGRMGTVPIVMGQEGQIREADLQVGPENPDQLVGPEGPELEAGRLGRDIHVGPEGQDLKAGQKRHNHK